MQASYEKVLALYCPTEAELAELDLQAKEEQIAAEYHRQDAERRVKNDEIVF